jgi:hypothetical protein
MSFFFDYYMIVFPLGAALRSDPISMRLVLFNALMHMGTLEYIEVKGYRGRPESQEFLSFISSMDFSDTTK